MESASYDRNSLPCKYTTEVSKTGTEKTICWARNHTDSRRLVFLHILVVSGCSEAFGPSSDVGFALVPALFSSAFRNSRMRTRRSSLRCRSRPNLALSPFLADTAVSSLVKLSFGAGGSQFGLVRSRTIVGRKENQACRRTCTKPP